MSKYIKNSKLNEKELELYLDEIYEMQKKLDAFAMDAENGESFDFNDGESLSDLLCGASARLEMIIERMVENY